MAWFKKKISAGQLGSSLALLSFTQANFLDEKLQSTSEIAQLPEEEKSDLHIELIIFSLFTIVAGVRSAVSDEAIQKIILDKMHESVYEMFVDTSGMGIRELELFQQHIHDKYVSYYNALQEHEGGHAMTMLGKQFVDNAFGANLLLVKPMLYIPIHYVNLAAEVKNMIENFKIRQ